jgi:hypothetical protein
LITGALVQTRDEGQQWQRYELAPAGFASTTGGITAVSRIPNSMEVWWIGANGSVQAAYWYEGQQWQRYELAPAGFASTTGGITALSHPQQHGDARHCSKAATGWYNAWRRKFKLFPRINITGIIVSP